MAASFDCPPEAHGVDMMKAVQAVLDDNPLVAYFDRTQIQTVESKSGTKVILTVVHPKPRAQEMAAGLGAKADEIALQIKSASRNDCTMLVNLYKYLQKNVRYDENEREAVLKGKCNSPSAHNAYGALLNGVAVCDGFSSAFALLAQKLGFECMLVAGRSADPSAGSVSHAWNIVKARGRFYHMDVTYDARYYDELGMHSYEYFALKDEEISSDHGWDKSRAPACSHNDISYYSLNGTYIESTDRLCEIVKKHGGKLDMVFRIKLSPSVSFPGDTGKYLADMITSEWVKTSGNVKINYGWNEKTRCFFAKAEN